MDASVLAEVQRWYYAQNNGDWEHCYGIEIGTLDNPGWHVSIDLADTELEDALFTEIKHNEIGQNYGDNPDWFVCRKVDGKFKGAGGPEQLETILRVFLTWVHSQPNPPLT
jgi:hypothetical protein